MLIIAVIVSVTIGITKAKLNNIVSYTYYSAYSTLRSVSSEMLADWDPKDEEYMEANRGTVKPGFFDRIFQAVVAGDYWVPDYSQCSSGCSSQPNFFSEDFCRSAGLSWCNENEHIEGTGCFGCCTPKCNIQCSLNYQFDPCSCTCTKECYDGTVVNSWETCPEQPIYTCWDGSQVLNPANCPSKIQCWDGSYVTNTSDCPSYVTCWDGSKKSDYSQCPSCPNTPAADDIPCGQSWNSQTCQLEGVPKVCSNGQHLNDNCECINSCPAEPGCGKTCDPSSGIISDIVGFNRNCSDESYEWNEEQCKCIPSPRTLPRKGMNFCKLFEKYANIMSGTEVCNGSTVSTSTTDFSDKSPDLTLRNGLRLYNMHRNAERIDALRNNTQGGTYDGVDNTNEWGYTVYVDIDGSKGDSQLWSDVYPFYITLSGKVIPAYDSSNLNSGGGDSVLHLQVSAENEHYNSGKRSTKWLAKNVSFKEGACITGYVGDSTPYCKTGNSYTQADECTTSVNSFCRVKQIQPVRFFF